MGIKSYVLRRGRMTCGQQRAANKLWSHYGVEVCQAPDWRAIFSRVAPLTVEIGGGYGEAAVALAQACPQDNFVVLEVYAPGIGALLGKLAAAGLQNVRVARADAATALPLFANGEVRGVRVFFPDPWPKKRHRKRRLINPAFVELLAQKIKPGGFVHLATDWAEYAEQMHACFAACEKFFPTTAAAAGCGVRPPTRFAARAEREERVATDLIFTRR